MTAKQQSLQSLEAWRKRERLVEDFEAAWQRGEKPLIGDFLHPDNADRLALLLDLIEVEMEFRIGAGEKACVEDYFRQFPEILQDQDKVLEMIGREHDLHKRTGRVQVAADYLSRFPQYGKKLQVLLMPAPEGTRPADATPVPIHCPHCHTAIEVESSSAAKEVVCPSCGASFHLEAAATTKVATPEGLHLVGRFQLIQSVGIGAFGTVYKARDPELHRTVAVKIPRAGIFSSEGDRQRFLREARSVAQLRHPSIVSIHDVGNVNGLPYLVSEFVEGVTLSDMLTGRRQSFKEAARLLAALADALQYAHDQGVIHRDVKPANIMVSDDGTPRLMDFGLAKRDAGEISMTIDGQILGTPAYMSPEQAAGEGHQVDGRSDVYSLGVIFYELLTGELPFRGNQRMMLHQVLHDEPRSPRRLSDHIPPDLETICLKAMAKEPSRRYAIAREFGDDLRRFLNNEPIKAKPAGAWERAIKWAKRKPAVAGLWMVSIGASVIVVFSGLWTMYTLGQKNRELEASYDRLKGEYETTARMAELITGGSENPTGLEGFHLRVPPSVGEKRTIVEALHRGLLKAERTTSTSSLPARASVLDAIGNAYRVLGLHEEAEKHLKEALQIREEKPGEDQLDLAASYHGLGFFYHDRGRIEQQDYKQAEKYYDLALEIRRRAKRNRALLSETLLNKAWLFAELQEEQKARECLQELMEEQRNQKLPTDGSEVLRAQIAQGCMELEWQGPKTYIEGIPRLIGLVKKLLKAEDNEKLIDAFDFFLNGLSQRFAANLLPQKLADPLLSKAEANFENALKSSEGKFGEQILPAVIRFFLADTQAMAGKDTAAETNYQEFFKIIRETVGNEHQLIPFAASNYANFLAKKKSHSDIMPLFEQVLAAQEKRFGRNHFFVARAKAIFAEFFREQGLYAQQLKLAQEAVDIYERPDCPPGPKEKQASRCKELREMAKLNIKTSQ